MAGRIGLEADNTNVNLAAGETGVVRVTLTNLGAVVDAFDLSIRNLDPSWFDLNPARLSLFPRAQGVATLLLHPPVAARALAGEYNFEIVATSRDANNEFASVPMRIMLASSGEVSINIEPKRIVARKGTYSLVVNNASNTERTIVLRPTDDGELLAFAFGQVQFWSLSDEEHNRTALQAQGIPTLAASEYVSKGTSMGESVIPANPMYDWVAPSPESGQGTLTISIPANARAELTIAVKPKKRVWFGREINYKFDVAATPPGIEVDPKDVRKASGELAYGPILGWMTNMPFALRRLLIFLIPLLILACLLFLLLRPKDEPKTDLSASQTATALALSAAQTQTAVAGLSSAQQTAAAQTAQAVSAQQTASAKQTSAAQTALASGVTSADQTATALAGAGGPLRIVSFDWSSTPDGGVQATWEVTPTNNITVTINGTPVPAVGSQVVDIKDDVSLILEATNGKDEVSRALGVALLRPPTIKLFAADPVDSPCSGCAVTLRWDTTRAEKVSIDGTPVPDTTGSMEVKPSTTTQYLLTVENFAGQTQGTTSVNVAPGLPTATPGP